MILTPRKCICYNCQLFNKWGRKYQSPALKTVQSQEFVKQMRELDDKILVCWKKLGVSSPSLSTNPRLKVNK